MQTIAISQYPRSLVGPPITWNMMKRIISMFDREDDFKREYASQIATNAWVRGLAYWQIQPQLIPLIYGKFSHSQNH